MSVGDAADTTRPGDVHPDSLPRRLTQSQIIGMLLTRGGREHSSVTLTRNAKGETQIDVVVRTGESDDVTTVDEAAEKAQAVYDRLRSRFPMSSGYVGATGPQPAPPPGA